MVMVLVICIYVGDDECDIVVVNVVGMVLVVVLWGYCLDVDDLYVWGVECMVEYFVQLQCFDVWLFVCGQIG